MECCKLFEGKTKSVCPICLKIIDAKLVYRDGYVYLEKKCLEHGSFSSVVWKNKVNFVSWLGASASNYKDDESCSFSCAACGICPEHKNGTCCVVYEVTSRCDMNCKFCFSNRADTALAADIPLELIKKDIESFVYPKRTLIQLSGGEPAMRDDLPDVVKIAKDVGCKYVQLNTNGIRIAKEPEYLKKLADSGLSFVFLQFDGMNDEIYRTLRGKSLLETKKRAIENCARFNIGVTLVPTVVRGVNYSNIGDILRFAISMSPIVRGVHFQPAAYIGRVPSVPCNEDRITLDELIEQINIQSENLIKIENIKPSRCDHPLCGFHGDFVVKEDFTLYPITVQSKNSSSCCGSTDSAADKNREFVGRRWKRNDTEVPKCDSSDITDMEYFISRVKSHGFTVTSMAFQDAGNLDAKRIRDCSLHVYKSGRLVPFCINYLTPFDS